MLTILLIILIVLAMNGGFLGLPLGRGGLVPAGRAADGPDGALADGQPPPHSPAALVAGEERA